MILDSLFVKLGFQVDTSKLQEFKQQAEELRGAVGKFAGIFTGVAAGIGLFVQHVAEGMAEVQEFAELNEMSAKSVAALGKIATENGSSLQDMEDSLQGLNRVIGEASLGIGRGAMTFQKLGLSAKDANGHVKTADNMLGEIADRMQGMSRAQQIALAEKLGINPKLVKLLKDGGENLANLREEAELMSPFSDKDYELALQIDKLFIKAKASLGVFSKQIAVVLMPTVRDLLKGYLDWFKSVRKATSGEHGKALQAFTAIVRRVYYWITQTAGKLADMVKWLVSTKVFAYGAAAALALFAGLKTYDAILVIIKGLRGMVAGLMAVNASAMLIPALIGLAVLAVAALVDDFIAFKNGGESVIGDLVKQFPMLGQAIEAIEGVVRSVGEYFVGLWAQIRAPVGDLMDALGHLGQVLLAYVWPIVKMAFQGWALLLPPILAVAAFVLGGIIELVAGLVEFVVGALSATVAVLAAIVDGIAAMFKLGLGNIGDLWDALMALFTGNFDKAGEKLLSIWQRVVDVFLGGFDRVKQAIQWIAEKLGFSSDITVAGKAAASGSPSAVAAAVAAAPAVQDAAGPRSPDAPVAPWAAPGGVMGKAESASTTTSTTTNTTVVKAPITVVSQDPARAGDAVAEALEQMNKQATRNGQSAVAL